TLLATAPLAFSTASIGWRASFLGVAGFTLVIGLIIAIVVKKSDAPNHDRPEGWRESLSGIVAVLRTPSVGRLFVMNMVMYSSFARVAGRGGGPSLSHIYAFGLEERGNMLLIPVLGQIVGAMLWGPTDRLLASHKIPVLIGAGLTAALLGYLAIAGTLSSIALVVWFAAFGLASAYFPVLIAHGKALFPPHQ